MDQTTTRTAKMTSATGRMRIIAGCLLAAMIAVTATARAETGSLEGQLIDSRLVSNISSIMFEYARHVDMLSRERAGERWAKISASAHADYNRLVWHMSVWQAGRSTAEVDEGIELQQMVTVYRAMHDGIAAAAREGRGAAAHHTVMAASVLDAIQTSLRRIENRNYSSIYDKAFKVASVN